MKNEWRRFECVNESNLGDLRELIEEKDITNQDIFLILRTFKIKQPMLMDWRDFLNDLLTEKQQRVLKVALQDGLLVYFYGRGIGKSTITQFLKEAGFKADEPGLHLEADGPEFRPEMTGLFLKIKDSKKRPVPELLETLRGQVESFKNWVFD